MMLVVPGVRKRVVSTPAEVGTPSLTNPMKRFAGRNIGAHPDQQ